MPFYRHGHRPSGGPPSPTYVSWTNMKSRCNNPNNTQYGYYGGRGVRVCPEWDGRDGFLRFLQDMGERPDGTSLDRIDPDGDYTPENCRWATRSEQQNNQRRNTKYLVSAS